MKIFMIGDSTMKFNKFNSYPQTGWGQVLHLFVKNDILVEDYAENGRSSKSFIAEGRFDEVLSKINSGDYLICQFGHNDEKVHDSTRYTEPYGEYQRNLKYFADSVIKKGGKIVFATSITRHKFVDGVCVNSHGDYPQAMLDLCRKNCYTCIDLNKLTIDLYSELGEEYTKKYHMIFDKNVYENYLEGKDDHSHLLYDGAVKIAELFVRAISETNDPINECFIDLENKEEIDYKMLID
ncbi:MAG: rhamnogalacturonan acetylesterase [Anaeroplasma sp.]